MLCVSFCHQDLSAVDGSAQAKQRCTTLLLDADSIAQCPFITPDDSGVLNSKNFQGGVTSCYACSYGWHNLLSLHLKNYRVCYVCTYTKPEYMSVHHMCAGVCRG